MSGCPRERGNDQGEILGQLDSGGTAQPKHRYSLFHFISVNECPKNYNICDTEYGKGWLAIAKLKPLSLFISLFQKGWGQSAKLGTHSAICSKLGTALQAYALNPCTKFPPNPTSRKVNT